MINILIRIPTNLTLTLALTVTLTVTLALKTNVAIIVSFVIIIAIDSTRFNPPEMNSMLSGTKNQDSQKSPVAILVLGSWCHAGLNSIPQS